MSLSPQSGSDTGPVFDIRRFGAVSDPNVLSSRAIQSAIDACHAAGGGRVDCPPGVYRIGTLELKSNVDLHLHAGATLRGSTDKADYPALDCRRANAALPDWDGYFTYRHHLIRACSAENVAITGRGVIDGQGDAFFGPRLRPYHTHFWPKDFRPGQMIAFIRCQNVLLDGVTIRDSPGFTVWPFGCDHVRIHGIRILNNREGPNTDGLDPDCCRDVRISDCHIDAGDDCIALKTNARMLGEDKPCEDVTVTNCTLSTTGCAVRVGYEGDAAIRNCAFNNLVFLNSRTGINMLVPRDEKSGILHGPTIENISFSNIVMDTRIPLYLWIGDDAAAPGAIRNVSISDVIATTERACYMGGSRSIPIESVRLSRIDLTVRGQTDAEFAEKVPYPYPVFDDWRKRGIPHGLYARHVRGLELSGIRVHWDRAVGPWHSALRCENVEDLLLDRLVARQGPESDAPVVHLTDVRRAFLRGCRSEAGARRFLRLEGGSTSGIAAIGNHLVEANCPFDVAEDVPADALQALANTGTPQ